MQANIRSRSYRGKNKHGKGNMQIYTISITIQECDATGVGKRQGVAEK